VQMQFVDVVLSSNGQLQDYLMRAAYYLPVAILSVYHSSLIKLAARVKRGIVA